MTHWDKKLLKHAYITPYRDYQVVFDMVEMADTDEAKYKLNTIAELLFDIYQERRSYDPKKVEGLQEVWKRCLSFCQRIVRKVLGKRVRKTN